MRRMESSVSSLRSGMGALVAIQGAQFFASMASAAAGWVRSLVAMGQQQAEVIDQQSKLAARLGMTYGEFAGIALAGELAGVGMDTVANAASRADVAFIRAQNGSAQAQKAFANLGLSMDELAAMSPAQRFQAIAQAIAELPTEAERAAAATALFGRAGMQLLPMFSGGAAAIQEAAAQAERLGLALTTAQGQDVEAMNDAFTLAGQAINGVIQQVTAYLAPAVKAVADTFTNLVGSIGGATIGQAIGDGILQGARFLAEIGDWFIANMSSVWQYVVQVAGRWMAVWDAASRVGSLFAAVGRLVAGAFLSLVGVFSGIAQGILTAVRAAASAVGFDTGTLDTALAALDGFNQQLNADITANFDAAAENFAAAIGDSAEAAGGSMAGPLVTALDGAIAQAEASAGQIEEAGQGAAAQVAAASKPNQAIKGIESRSAEGIAEMFRLMRSTPDQDVQRQQLNVLERIADNTDGMGDQEFDTVELAPAAGF